MGSHARVSQDGDFADTTDLRGGVALVAAVAAVLAGFHVEVALGVRTGGVVALALTPVWLARSSFLRPVVVLAITAGLAVASGIALTVLREGVYATSTRDAVTRGLILVSIAATTGMLVWVARVLGPARMAVAVGVGLVLGIPFNISDDPNVWRFTLSIPIGVLLLALASASRLLLPQLAAAAALAVVGSLNDSRSNTAMLLVAVAVLLLSRFGEATKGRAAIRVVAMLLVAYGAYSLVQAAILEGYFGESTRLRTEAQIETSGSLILGGRPEMAATVALVRLHPLGLGAGVTVDAEDAAAAKDAMFATGYDPRNGYVNRYMFGSGVEVHSVIGDAWLWFGLAGVAFVVIAAVLVVKGLLGRLQLRTVDILYLYLMMRMAWDLAFSPLLSASRLLPLTLALAITWSLAGRPRPRTTPPGLARHVAHDVPPSHPGGREPAVLP